MTPPLFQYDCVTVGESMALFTADAPGKLADVSHYTRHIAGAESNVVIGLARLGLRVAWVSRLGNDQLGHYLQREISAEGVDCSTTPLLQGERTGLMFKSMSCDGTDPEVEYHRKGSAASTLGPADLPHALIAQSRHLHLTGILPALSTSCDALSEAALRQARQLGVRTSFDVNLRPALWPNEATMRTRLHALAALSDWVMPGLGEAQRLTGLTQPHDIADFYLGLGCQVVILKLGEQGAFLKTAEQEVITVPAVAVRQVVDTVGAGDGFSAGVISARLDGLPWRQALERGAWIGARQVQVKGDIDGLPTRQQLRAQGLP
jgi:sugar/nucleoside kinase (ribokinase family)